MKTHCNATTKLADAAHAARYLLVTEGSDADHVAVCDADEKPSGLCTDQPAAAEDPAAVAFLSAANETRPMVPAGAIDEGDKVYTADGGKVQAEPAVAGTYYLVGEARQSITVGDSANAGATIEVEPCAPIKVVVVAALTSTDGTAAGAADLTALKAEAEKIGDDVRALGAALAGPALVKVLAA